MIRLTPFKKPADGRQKEAVTGRPHLCSSAFPNTRWPRQEEQSTAAIRSQAGAGLGIIRAWMVWAMLSVEPRAVLFSRSTEDIMRSMNTTQMMMAGTSERTSVGS